MTVVTTSNRLKIRRIKIIGKWDLDYICKNGLNAIVAPNKHGKTTFLEIIFKCLGLRDKRNKEAKENADQVFLEFELNNDYWTILMVTTRLSEEKYRTTYLIQKNKTIDTFKKNEAEPIKGEDLINLIEKKLNFFPYVYRDKINNKNPLNNLGNVYRSFYLLQGHEQEIITDYAAADTRRIVIQSVLRNVNDSNMFEDRYIDLSNDLKESEAELEFSLRYLREHRTNIIKVLNDQKIKFVDDNLDDILKIKGFITIIKKNMDTLVEDQKICHISILNAQKSSEKDTRLQELSNENRELLNQSVNIQIDISLKQNQVNDLQKRLNNYKEKILDFQNRIRDENFQVPFNYYERTTFCPRCGRDVPNSHLDFEHQIPPKCALCGEKRTLEGFSTEQLNAEIGSYKLKIKEKEVEVEALKANMKTKKENLNALNDTINKKNVEFESLKAGKIESNIKTNLDKLTKINDTTTILTTNINEIKEFSSNLEKSIQLPKKIKSINNTKKKFEAEIKFGKEVEAEWKNSISIFMQQVGLKELGKKVIEIEPSTYLPVIDGKKWKEIDDNDKHIYNLAVYYAFLICSLKFPIKFPRFLLWDCWATAELDAEKIKRICVLFQNLLKQYPNDFQMIFSTAEVGVLPYIEKDKVLLRKQNIDTEEFLFLENGAIKYSQREK